MQNYPISLKRLTGGIALSVVSLLFIISISSSIDQKEYNHANKPFKHHMLSPGLKLSISFF